ncbi:hypothetical protein [Noviherbaspirillum denitrificans]|uniref:hypothetical protein n=1 Tax=Noviherbaspirillum denitrificans TaxID=1968433 RepID=UPI00112FDE25|nr:hypothetical protein [Noviherbaspirillum denitrificans]
MKIVIDYSGDGLRLTAEAFEHLKACSTSDGSTHDHLLDHCTLTSYAVAVIPPYPRQLRHHPELLDLVSCLGKRTFCSECDVRVVDIPDGVDWKIGEIAGFEWIDAKAPNEAAAKLELCYTPL